MAKTFPFRQHLIVLACLLVTALSLLALGEVTLVPSAQNWQLPDPLADHTVATVYYCQDLHCGGSLCLATGKTATSCPKCGRTVDIVAPAEAQMLPVGTRIDRHVYITTTGKQYLATLLLTGKERTGIHRPQMCLPAQGYTIVRGRTLSVPRHGREALGIQLLTVESGPPTDRERMYLGYWFASDKRETASHLKRTAWMAFDNVVHGTAPEWAYISVFVEATKDEESDIRQLERFLQELEPRLRPQ